MTLRLIEKIRNLESAKRNDFILKHEDVLQSIRHHLNLILNTKKGSTLIDDEFGVPDFTNLVGGLSGGSHIHVEKSIETMIKKYEPRLLSPKIELITGEGDILSMQFKINASIQVNDSPMAVRIHANVNASGRITIV